MLNKSLNKILPLLIFSLLFAVSCGGGSDEPKGDPNDPMNNKGIGPVKSLPLPAMINVTMAKEGEELFKLKCTACHKIDTKYIGPALKGVTERRSPEWIMNMILNPDVMVKQDPIAKQLLAQFLSPMANQQLKEPEARKILEYLRTNK